jgi:hypothetical protein
VSQTASVAVDMCVVPVDNEVDDLESIALAKDLFAKLRSNLTEQTGLKIISLPTTSRSGDLFEITRALAQSAYDHRAELTGLISMAITTITALSSNRRIDSIEVIMGDKKVTFKGVDIDQAPQLIHEIMPTEPAKAPPAKPRMTVRTRKQRS